VETLVALVILTVALLLGLSILTQQPKIQLKLRAHQEAHAALARVLEGLRAGTVPVASGAVSPSPVTPIAADGLVVRLTVDPDPDVPGLSRVTAVASYTVRGQLLERRVETLTWRRP
jgi:type II secretory pathway pseudopilin PulG